MPYTPPFNITVEILNLAADISQQVGRLDVSALKASPQLRKQNRIKTITGTLAIEGNTLTESKSLPSFVPSNLIFCKKRPEKASICQNLGIDRFNDDNQEVISSLSGIVQKTTLFNGSVTWDSLLSEIKANKAFLRIN